MQRRWTAVTAGGAAIVLVAGVVAALTWQPKELTGPEVLDRVDRFVAKAGSYSFAGRGASSTVHGEPPAPVSSIPATSPGRCRPRSGL
ncbi:MAG: hypothetical protein ACRD2W_20710 [Acidimicrobiales bacterium]